MLYAESGVKEYLIFDPEHENVFQFHLNEKGFYDIKKIYVDDEILTSIIFPDLSIDLTEIFNST
jgi:Uma2 family endonuclease